MLLRVYPACLHSCAVLPVCFLPISFVPSSIWEGRGMPPSPIRFAVNIASPLPHVLCVSFLGMYPTSWAAGSQGRVDWGFPKDWVSALGTATVRAWWVPCPRIPTSGWHSPLANLCYPIRTNVTSHLLSWIHISLMTGWLCTSLLGLICLLDFLSFLRFFWCGPFWNFYWICCNIVSILCLWFFFWLPGM